MKKIECVIMDWAGTAVDYGCFAPVAAFIDAFASIGVDITADEARAPMGMTKIDHIRTLFAFERISGVFRNVYGREYGEEDVLKCYAEFERRLFATLSDYTDPIEGVIETLDIIRKSGVKIGSTTGYTSEMMKVVVPAAESKGYHVDNCVTSDGLPGGRPLPFMIYKNMCDLAVASRFSVLKYGDTISDIKEGVNAGVWTVGVILGSSELGLTEKEIAEMPSDELKRRMNAVRNRMYDAGAHYVVESVHELPALIESINARMSSDNFMM